MIEYLEINGKKYPVKIGYYVMKHVKAETDLSFSDCINKALAGEVKYHEVILYYALKMGAYVEKTEMPFERDDMEFVVDLCYYDYMKLYTSEKFFPKIDENDEEKTGKKKGKVKDLPLQGKVEQKKKS